MIHSKYQNLMTLDICIKMSSHAQIRPQGAGNTLSKLTFSSTLVNNIENSILYYQLLQYTSSPRQERERERWIILLDIWMWDNNVWTHLLMMPLYLVTKEKYKKNSPHCSRLAVRIHNRKKSDLSCHSFTSSASQLYFIYQTFIIIKNFPSQPVFTDFRLAFCLKIDISGLLTTLLILFIEWLYQPSYNLGSGIEMLLEAEVWCSKW